MAGVHTKFNFKALPKQGSAKKELEHNDHLITLVHLSKSQKEI